MIREERKVKGIEIMKKMDIFKPYIEDFEKHDRVCYFEYYAGYWVFQEPEVEAKMREIEETHKCTVYAITHEFTEFGELYTFLLVTDRKGEWKNLCVTEGNTHYCFAYVWNKDADFCSEFGTVGIKSFGGGITRVE